MEAPENIRRLIERKLAFLGLELYDIRYFRAGSRDTLRVFVDKESGITIADCESASRELSILLDVEEFSKRPYTLEVSSPGLDRPLIAEKDFIRAKGRRITLRVAQPGGTHKTIAGVLIDYSDGALRLESKSTHLDIALSDVLSGKIEVSFK
jgi:ribosome maturation factor RimP